MDTMKQRAPSILIEVAILKLEPVLGFRESKTRPKPGHVIDSIRTLIPVAVWYAPLHPGKLRIHVVTVLSTEGN